MKIYKYLLPTSKNDKSSYAKKSIDVDFPKNVILTAYGFHISDPKL